MSAIKSILILIAAVVALNFLLAHNPFPTAPQVSNQAYTDPTVCHREADNVPVEQLVDTIKRMQQECGVPPLTPRVTETPEEQRRACEDLKAQGYIDSVDECLSNVGGWHQR